jgi:hypothetical protein
VVTVPTFETTPEAVQATVEKNHRRGNAARTALAGFTPAEVNVPPTPFVALDDLDFLVRRASGTVGPDRADQHQRRRARCRDGRHQEACPTGRWALITARMSIGALTAFAATQPRLAGEDKKLLDETLRDYRRAGLALPRRRSATRWNSSARN